MCKHNILFDLDGTLTDPAIGITNSVMYALDKFGITVSDRAELYKFIGPPLLESFETYYGFSKEQTNAAIEYYREYFSDKGLYENAVYDGMPELLETLVNMNKTLIVATSKPAVFAKKILAHFELSKYFTFVAGSELDGTRVKKDEVIAYALENCRINDLSQIVMIGDRKHDIIGAKKTGISSIGVLYGYGDYDELSAAGADYIAAGIGELRDILINNDTYSTSKLK